jgi:hypothetical protein
MISKQEISQLCRLPDELIADFLRELEAAQIPWKEAYSHYQSGGWYVAPLANSTGTVDQLRLDAGKPIPTPLYEQFPSIRKWLDASGLDICLVRLAKIDPNSWMHEHVDDVGINENRLRLHIPLQIDPEAVLCFDGVHIFALPGFLWKLDHERVRHSAANFGKSPRIHLIVDCRVNEYLQSLVSQDYLDDEAVRKLPILSVEAREILIQKSLVLLRENKQQEAEDVLLCSFNKLDLDGLSSYDLLCDLYSRRDDPERLQYWCDRLKLVTGREFLRPMEKSA